MCTTNSSATHVLLAEALFSDDSECVVATNELNNRWATWQRDYGTGAVTASQSAGHKRPPQPPDSRLAHAPKRAEPPPQPTGSRLAVAPERYSPVPPQPRARRPRVRSPASSLARSEPARVMAHQEEPDIAQCEADEWRHMQVRPKKYMGGSMMSWSSWGTGICDIRRPLGRGWGGAASLHGDRRESEGKVLRHAISQMCAIRRVRCELKVGLCRQLSVRWTFYQVDVSPGDWTPLMMFVVATCDGRDGAAMLESALILELERTDPDSSVNLSRCDLGGTGPRPLEFRYEPHHVYVVARPRHL